MVTKYVNRTIEQLGRGYNKAVGAVRNTRMYRGFHDHTSPRTRPIIGLLVTGVSLSTIAIILVSLYLAIDMAASHTIPSSISPSPVKTKTRQSVPKRFVAKAIPQA